MNGHYPAMSRDFTIVRHEIHRTVRTCNGAVGAARGLLPDLKVKNWVKKPNPYPWESITVINDDIEVFEHKL
jgi:hypothetical protein